MKEEFVYLRSLVTSDNNCSRRIVAGSHAYYGLHKRSGKLPPTKCTMYKVLKRPVFIYGYETSTMFKKNVQTLVVFERCVLRTIFGCVCKPGV